MVPKSNARNGAVLEGFWDRRAAKAGQAVTITTLRTKEARSRRKALRVPRFARHGKLAPRSRRKASRDPGPRYDLAQGEGPKARRKASRVVRTDAEQI